MNREEQIQRWIKSGADARRGKSKYSSDEEKLEAKRRQAREYVKRSYAKNPERWKKYYKKYWENATDEQKRARTLKKLQYSRDAREKYPDRPAKYYKMLKDDWTGGVDCRDREVWEGAENIALDIVENLGYKNLYNPKFQFQFFYYDILSKEDRKITAFQVTTLRTRLIKNKHIELAEYLGWDFYVIHIKPTFDIAYITKIDTKIKNKQGTYYHFNKGKKIIL
jgi:hypothetical protein